MKSFTDLTEWYQFLIDYFNEKKAPIFIHGSTLLGAVRNNTILERIPFDKEINFGIKAEDLTQQLLSDMQHDFPYFNALGGEKQNSLIYFGPEPIIQYLSKNENHWDMEPGFALLAVFWRTKTKWVESMGCNACLTWPLYQLESFSCMNLGGRKVATPIDKHEWLSHYFGEDYMTENIGWHWATNSHNMEKYTDLIDQF